MATARSRSRAVGSCICDSRNDKDFLVGPRRLQGEDESCATRIVRRRSSEEPLVGARPFAVSSNVSYPNVAPAPPAPAQPLNVPNSPKDFPLSRSHPVTLPEALKAIAHVSPSHSWRTACRRNESIFWIGRDGLATGSFKDHPF